MCDLNGLQVLRELLILVSGGFVLLLAHHLVILMITPLHASQGTESWSLIGLGNSRISHDADVYCFCMEARGYAIK